MDDSVTGVIDVFLLSPRPHIEGEQPGADNELEWVWVHGLSIPKTHLYEFSVKPYKWIRFVAGALLGVEGILCDSLDNNAIEIDYDRPLIPADSSLYFHTDPTEHERILPLDPSLACSSTITGSSTSLHFQRFMGDIVTRDVRCVASNLVADECEVVHLIGHSKGHDYIRALTATRSGGSETIDDINDTRNKILVNHSLHTCLAQRQAAFLLTPNFAMSTSDVGTVLPPDVNRWTVHDFKRAFHPQEVVEDRIHSLCVPHKQPLRVPADESQWPPRVIFDAVYASTVARHFGHEDFAAFVRNHWQCRYYSGGRANAHGGGKAELYCQRTQKDKTMTEHKEQREGRSNERHDREEMDPLDMIFSISQFARAPPKAERHERQVTEQMTVEAAKHAELDQKVNSWLGAVR
ncbi:hypothetical protein A0H81_00089 [Grifola frondosa]|uniref:HNH nuclease domain-containing protein n=1 Tax=Grifola frondosa TaxID=5627 RepID=A0A1C7MQ87_GRIFR|nr:hypothetical protein A0H81_00089 [Grifola frondosa]